MSATKELDRHIQDLEDTWDYTREELNDIRDKMIDFANTVSSNEKMREEVAKIEKIY
jgi:hypothetical protein